MTAAGGGYAIGSGAVSHLWHAPHDPSAAAATLWLPDQPQADAADDAGIGLAASGQTGLNAGPPTATIPIRAIPTGWRG